MYTLVAKEAAEAALLHDHREEPQSKVLQLNSTAAEVSRAAPYFTGAEARPPYQAMQPIMEIGIQG